VSGTREFGYELNLDGSYNFYTRGVDRFTQRLTSELVADILSSGNPFQGADELWVSFQDGIKKFVDENGGMATINAPIKGRTDWNKVKDILEGRLPVSSLEKCP
jgi:hypothetical protein